MIPCRAVNNHLDLLTVVWALQECALDGLHRICPRVSRFVINDYGSNTKPCATHSNVVCAALQRSWVTSHMDVQVPRVYDAQEGPRCALRALISTTRNPGYDNRSTQQMRGVERGRRDSEGRRTRSGIVDVPVRVRPGAVAVQNSLHSGGNSSLEKLRPARIARRSISAADASQPLCSRKSRNARVLILRQLSGTRKLVRAIL